MLRFLSLLLFLVAAAANAAVVPTVLIFGDSLSAGYGIDVDRSWTALLQSRLNAQGYEHRVINASISGETTEGGKTRISSALKNFSPDLVILELGGNDGLRGFPPEVMKSNLQTIIETTRASGASIVLLGIRIPSNYGPRYTSAFEAVYRDLADELDVPWIEFFMDGVALNEELMQDDGIHPNEDAQPILLDNAWPIIREALTEQTGRHIEAQAETGT
jgi:acyl-CoA thioesterase-1